MRQYMFHSFKASVGFYVAVAWFLNMTMQRVKVNPLLTISVLLGPTHIA